MRRRLLVSLATFILVLATAQSFAAETTAPSTPGAAQAKRREAFERFKAALEQLDLSDQQKESIKSIVAAAKAKLEALKGEKGERGERRQIIEQARKDIVAQLTEEQQKKLREILASDRAAS